MVTIYKSIKEWLGFVFHSWMLSYRLWQLKGEIAWTLQHGSVRDLREGGSALENFGRDHGLDAMVVLGRQMQWEAEDIVLSR